MSHSAALLEWDGHYTKVPGLDACAAWVTAKLVHFPHKEGRGQATKYLGRVYIDTVGPMPVKISWWEGIQVCCCG